MCTTRKKNSYLELQAPSAKTRKVTPPFYNCSFSKSYKSCVLVINKKYCAKFEKNPESTVYVLLKGITVTYSHVTLRIDAKNGGERYASLQETKISNYDP